MAKKKTKKTKKTPQTATKPKDADKKSVAPPKKKADRKKDHVDGIVKTLYPAILGVVFGFISYYAFGTGVPEEGATGAIYPWYFIMLVVVTATYYFQRYTYPYLNVKVDEFVGKDWIYVEFIAVDLWLVTWTILLN